MHKRGGARAWGPRQGRAAGTQQDGGGGWGESRGRKSGQKKSQEKNKRLHRREIKICSNKEYKAETDKRTGVNHLL